MKFSLPIFLGVAVFSTSALACGVPGEACDGTVPLDCQCDGGNVVSLILAKFISAGPQTLGPHCFGGGLIYVPSSSLSIVY